MNEAGSLSLTLTESVIGGTTHDIRLVFAKPNRMRIDAPDRTTITDGKTVWTYDKAAKTYDEAPAGSQLANEWTHGNAWVYNAFFNPKFADEVASAVKGSSRKLRNVAVTDWTITRKDKMVYSVQIDDELGVARGVRFTRDKSEVFVFAKELSMKSDPLGESEFVFVAPAGVTKKEVGAVLTFADIKPILDGNCIGCHSGPSAKARIDLSSHAGVSRVVTAGDPNGSRMMRPVKRGAMPPTGALKPELIAKLDQWIKDGAKP